ncbi:hypothetical protein HanIR_Chr04g0188811 [Helianthus annuus]|nr:hypothetical protein HanIR_Chr04g0188811 [Helianthus annuus]
MKCDVFIFNIMLFFNIMFFKGKLHFSSFMFVLECNGCPSSSIITFTIIYL